MNGRFALAMLFTLIASTLSDIVFNILTGGVPEWLTFAKLLILADISVMSLFIKELKQFSKFVIVLTIIIMSQLITTFIISTSFWKTTFNNIFFIENFGSSILLKLIGIIPVIASLFLLVGSPKEFYLCKGALFIKASKIGWLGIKEDSISWGKLSLISALLISFGTALLTMFTVTNISLHKDMFQLLKYAPVIILMAILNSFCEGVIFRSAVLGTLKRVLPKNYAIIVAALFFGIGHYYGAPGGLVGVIMSSLLGWYMCRSMYETKGFASSWIIHFMQDIIIFSTIFLMGSYI